MRTFFIGLPAWESRRHGGAICFGFTDDFEYRFAQRDFPRYLRKTLAIETLDGICFELCKGSRVAGLRVGLPDFAEPFAKCADGIGYDTPKVAPLRCLL